MSDPQSIQQIASQVNSTAHNLDMIIIGLPVAFAILAPLVNIFFCWSCYSIMRKIPKQHRAQPAWLSWLMVIPFVGHIFQWIMLPFAIPSSIKNYTPDSTLQKQAHSLYLIGLWYVMLTLLTMIPYTILILAIPMLILWIVYWVKVSNLSFALKNMEASNNQNSNTNPESIAPRQNENGSDKPARPILLTVLLSLFLAGGASTLLILIFRFNHFVSLYQAHHKPIYYLYFTAIFSIVNMTLITFMLCRKNWARIGFVAMMIVGYSFSFYTNREHITLLLLPLLLSLSAAILAFTPKANRFFSSRADK